MKQFLRSFLTLLMLVVWASGFAADKTYSYTFKSGGSFTADKQTKTFGGVNWTITSDGYLSFEGNNKAQQIGSKKKPAKNTVISTSDFPGTIKTIEINGWQGTDANANVEVFVGGVSYGKKDFSTNKTDEHIFNGASSGALKIQIINPASGGSIAAFIKTISVTYEEGPAKTATTLTFPKSVINIEEGNEASFAAQTAILKAGETELNNAITYTTNNDAMFEAYEVNVGPKTLKAGEYGTAVVTATFAGDDTYAASTATYTVNYTEKAKPATTLDFGFTTKTVNIDETFTAAATLKSGETAITGAVTYSSSTPEVAYVDEATGEVLALAAGKATITATFAGTSEYKSSTASYELTVVDPNATEETFDFTKPENYVHKGLPNTGDYIELEEGTQITSGIITITNVQNGNTNGYTNKARFHNKGGNITFRVYANGTISLSAEAGYTITKFTFEATEGGNLTTSSGTYTSQTRTWEGNAQSLSLTFNEKTFFQKLTVTYSKVATTTPLTLEEDADDTVSKIEANNGKTIDVKLTRSLKAGLWNTICLPFDVTADQVESVLKATGKVKEFDKEDKATATIFFKPATEMKAGVPYLIKPTEDATVLNFKDVTINNVDEFNRIKGNSYCICGVFGKTKLRTTGADLFLNAAGKFVAPAVGKETMKGFRAYFNVPLNVSAAALNINIDGETTGINNIETNATINGKVYNLNGQYVGNSLNGLKKGIYVVNGKKVIK